MKWRTCSCAGAEYIEVSISAPDQQGDIFDRVQENLDEMKINLLEHSLDFLDYRTDVPKYFQFKEEVLAYASMLYGHNSEEYRRLIRLFEAAEKRPLFKETNGTIVPEVRAIIRRAREILESKH